MRNVRASSGRQPRATVFQRENCERWLVKNDLVKSIFKTIRTFQAVQPSYSLPQWEKFIID